MGCCGRLYGGIVGKGDRGPIFSVDFVEDGVGVVGETMFCCPTIAFRNYSFRDYWTTR